MCIHMYKRSREHESHVIGLRDLRKKKDKVRKIE